jgi:adenine-specific DNA-methyltransferase
MTEKARVKRVELPPRKFPLFIKYMGSKAKIINFVVSGIEEVYQGGPVCDLFAGACNLSGAIGHEVPILSNDIQEYSSVLANVFLRCTEASTFIHSETIITKANDLVQKKLRHLPHDLCSGTANTITEFKRREESARRLIDSKFPFDYHLFVKNYSGTWWSAEQCLWIDSIREVADEFGKDSLYYFPILASLMYAMAYSSQGTGHYAQWRDATSISSMHDIQIYRKRSITDYFCKKFDSLSQFFSTNKRKLRHEITTSDFRVRLESLPRCTVYADPPYCFVHYSRFYHALETLVKYDYPELQYERGRIVKGRYRADRHQSPFCIRSQVADAFTALFKHIRLSGSSLVLSYSKSALIPLSSVISLAQEALGKKYTLTVRDLDHRHMTMGRKQDRHREVKECLILARLI